MDVGGDIKLKVDKSALLKDPSASDRINYHIPSVKGKTEYG